MNHDRTMRGRCGCQSLRVEVSRYPVKIHRVAARRVGPWTIVRQPTPATFDVAAIGTDLIDECALALRLGISRSTLQSWRYAGRGPRFIKVGRLVRYRNADVDAYLEAHTHKLAA